MIPIVEIIRLETSKSYGTLGILKLNKKIIGVTLEPSDEGNRVNVSSIPTGQYDCARVKSGRHGDTFEVMNVTGRTNILFHPGNTRVDTKGCIILGQYVDKLLGDRAVKNSGKTFADFMHKIAVYDEFGLTVSECY
jgi:hypothetical protein